jgi:proteasome lid subunit RPN8/RPN11
MTEKLMLTKWQWKSMRRHVSRCAPLEACGLLAGKNDRVEWALGIPNADRSPVRFHMDPRRQLRAFERIESAGLDLVGIYHSHPNGPDHPSATDISEAMYPVVQLLWYRQDGKWQVRGFWIEADEYSEITLRFD